MKRSNEYAQATRINAPKTVWMALAYSFAVRCSSDPDSPTIIEAALYDEWRILHQNGIVPQRPRGGIS